MIKYLRFLTIAKYATLAMVKYLRFSTIAKSLPIPSTLPHWLWAQGASKNNQNNEKLKKQVGVATNPGYDQISGIFDHSQICCLGYGQISEIFDHSQGPLQPFRSPPGGLGCLVGGSSQHEVMDRWPHGLAMMGVWDVESRISGYDGSPLGISDI